MLLKCFCPVVLLLPNILALNEPLMKFVVYKAVCVIEELAE
jgi:hypothetical protein